MKKNFQGSSRNVLPLNTLEQDSNIVRSVFIVDFEQLYVHFYRMVSQETLWYALNNRYITTLFCMSFDNIDLQIIRLTEHAEILKEPFLQFQIFFILLKR